MDRGQVWRPGLQCHAEGSELSLSFSWGVTRSDVHFRKVGGWWSTSCILSFFGSFCRDLTCTPSQPQCHDAAVAPTTCKAFRYFLVCSVSFVFLQMLFATLSFDFLSPGMFATCRLDSAGLERGTWRQDPRQRLLSLSGEEKPRTRGPGPWDRQSEGAIAAGVGPQGCVCSLKSSGSAYPLKDEQFPKQQEGPVVVSHVGGPETMVS